jgi:hypothetical protein
VRWRDPKLWLGALSLVAVMVLFLLDTQHATPGPLTTTHVQAHELAGNAGCVACHGKRGEKMARACATCHGEIGAQLADHAGFHGKLADGARCERCHREHHGDEVALVDDRAFALAGVADRAKFDHGHVAFTLTGVHAKLECKACHANADAALLEPGAKRFLGATQTCTACHEDPHQGRFVRGCETCHGQEHPFGEIANFTHTAAFPLTGAHARASCTDCHAKDSPRSVEALGGAGPHPAARTCVDCHATPHSRPFEQGVAALLGRNAEACCSECHAPSAPSFAVDATMTRELHAATGFALDAPHAQATCAQCHGELADGKPFAQRFKTRRAADDCAACHANPHGDQFARAGAKTSCLDCHAREHFQPASFDVAAHARTSFPLADAHAKAACSACHTQRDGEPRVFRGTPNECEQCHADVHGGSFANLGKHGATAVGDQRGGCAACHSTKSFADATLAPEQHASLAHFALDGAHARASCETCHARSGKPDAAGRTFGRVADVFGTKDTTCASCHRDVHAGAFDRAGLPANVAGRSGCARCHAQEHFRELATEFDHGAWTTFTLDGAHARTECAACHGTMADPRKAGRTLGRVADLHVGPTERCATCHVDAHEHAFERVEAGVDCARCHSTSTFDGGDGAKFAHARWTGFELDGEHARIACEACHVPARERDQFERRFGHAAGTACVDCHVDPHAGQFERGGATDCSRCHSSSGDFALVGFQHDRDTRFALDAQHKKLACSACHVPCATLSGEKVVRYKPLGTTCADCHGLQRRGGER